MITSLRSRIRKAAVAVALVGLFAGATATPALANHNSGKGKKVGHQNENGKRKGHAKQDGNSGPEEPGTGQEECESQNGNWVWNPETNTCTLFIIGTPT